MSQLTRSEPSHAIAELEKWHGRPVADFADYHPDRSYLHMITKDSPSMDEAILEGRSIRGLCGKSWVPRATSYLTPGGGPVRSICPVCAAIWHARGEKR